jgi:hypothetical protein
MCPLVCCSHQPFVNNPINISMVYEYVQVHVTTRHQVI